MFRRHLYTPVLGGGGCQSYYKKSILIYSKSDSNISSSSSSSHVHACTSASRSSSYSTRSTCSIPSELIAAQLLIIPCHTDFMLRSSSKRSEPKRDRRS